MSYHVVWFKRDLRLHDHAALAAAAQHGPVLCLYVIEPGLWAQPDMSARHYDFLLTSLRALDAELVQHGLRLQVVRGEMLDVLERLFAHKPFISLNAHEETGNGWTFARDRAVARWCRERGVQWQEYPQFGVVRRLKSRDHWQAAWETHVAEAQVSVPPLTGIPLPWPERRVPTAAALGLPADPISRPQVGGRTAGLAVLDEFLSARAGQYRGGISSPLSAPTACSRLSPYLAYGCLSLREIVQATRAQLAALPAGDRRRKGLSAFMSRLYWHCHFIQKLESQPDLEFLNLHRGYDDLREDEWNEAHFTALRCGQTGWPLVDACVVMLRETGWLNFRMRAMLVSVAAYPLWLHWREVGLWLAQQFVDYEPGIHWSQMQMQAGTTGINTTRVYNPIKQAQDHDPHGHFVRTWLPALRRVPGSWLFEPWRMPAYVQARCGVIVGRDIPLPMVDLEAATREAKARLHARRARPDVRAEVAGIVARHGSRQRPLRRKSRSPATVSQLELGL